MRPPAFPDYDESLRPPAFPDFDETLYIPPLKLEDINPFIPKRKRYAALELNAMPKVKPKPQATRGFPREVASRTAEDRQRIRLETAAAGGGDGGKGQDP